MNRLPTWQLAAAGIVLVALHVILALDSAARQSVTVDEIFHLTGGYCFDQLNDYRIHPDNGVLPQRLHALPAVLGGAKPPPLADSRYWREPDSTVFSYQFFYESGNDHWPLLLGARRVNLLFTSATVLLALFWARSLAGDTAGLLAGTLAAFSPTLLAHGPIATTDAAAALFLTASAGAWWWQLQKPDWRRVAPSAVTFGLACVTKYSAVILIPLFLATAVIHHLAANAAERRPGRVLASLAAHGVAAWLIIWACFGFRYAASAPGQPPAEQFSAAFDWMLSQMGRQGPIVRWLRDLRLFPEGFLFGYTHTYMGSLKRGAYLAGEFSDTGWKSFFPLAFLWKSTPAELLGLGIGLLAVVLQWRRLRPWLVKLAPLIVLSGIYGVIAITSHLNIGHRHLLPMYPALFIAVAVTVARLAERQRAFLLVAAALAGAQALIAATTTPHFLAYFNALGGPPQDRWRKLVDSSLDWGQDLAGLKQWLAENNSGTAQQPVHLSYFGSGEPGYYKLQAKRLPFINGFKIATKYESLEAGIYCISATTLVHVYSSLRGPWTAALEKEFQDLRALEPIFAEYTTNPSRRPELEREVSAEQWRRGWTRFDQLRFARLCHYLRRREPDDHVGGSILIYRLSAQEVRAATAGSLAEWQALCDGAGAARK